MFLIAQRVVDITTDQQLEGINTYRYHHGGANWDTPPGSEFRENNPGELVEKHLTPGFPKSGNRVRSFLDILAPDDALPEEITRAFHRFLPALAHAWNFPVESPQERCRFSFYADPGLVPVQEAKILFARLGLEAV